MAEIEGLIKELKSLDQMLHTYSGDGDSHGTLFASIKRLQILAEGPKVYASTLRFEASREATIYIAHGRTRSQRVASLPSDQVLYTACLFTAFETGMLPFIVAEDGRSVTASTLAGKTNNDPLLVCE